MTNVISLEQHRAALEDVIEFGRLGTRLNDDDVINRSEGQFLAVSRFYVRDERGEDGRAILSYNILRRMTPDEFYSHMDMPAKGPCTAYDISDHLVKAFDWGVAGELGLGPALFVYRAPDGRTVWQHST